MNRRTLLKGVATGSTGSIVSATRVGAVPVARSEPIAVRIVEAPDAVTGGELLEWTVEVENPTDEPVRPTLEYAVDGESLGRVTLTVEPGATRRPTTPSYRTEPVAADGELTVRVEGGGDSDERTVDLLAAPEFGPERQFPDRELTVRPETTVQFEVGTGDPDAKQAVSWWVDGERVGDTLADPWQAIYYAQRGHHYWQETFDAEGTYEVVAGVERDDQRYRASWTVTVAADGVGEPTVEAARPEPGTLEMDRDADTDDPTTLEVDVTDPDGSLERVVWWLTQADVILGESDVSGASDTASLTVDGGLCHTCRVVPWVLTSDGTVRDEAVWEVDSADSATENGSDGDLEVAIATTNEPVDAGDVLEVTVDCENTGTEPLRRDLELIVGRDPERVDTQPIAVDGGATETVTLAFETALVAADQSVPVRVETDNGAAECTVRVWGTGD